MTTLGEGGRDVRSRLYYPAGVGSVVGIRMAATLVVFVIVVMAMVMVMVVIMVMIVVVVVVVVMVVAGMLTAVGVAGLPKTVAAIP